MCDYVNAGMAKDQNPPDMFGGEACEQQPQTVAGSQYGFAVKAGSHSPLYEMEKRLASAQKDTQLLTVGVVFLRDNPQFNEFIRLIRIGAISI